MHNQVFYNFVPHLNYIGHKEFFSVPFIFDFKGIEKINYANDWRNHLYYLFPKSNVRESVVAIVSRESFIRSIITGEFFKERQEPQKQISKTPIKSNPTLPRRQFQYVFERGRYIKRRRL